MTAIMQKLGKKQPKQDPRTLRMLRYAPIKLPTYPAAYQWGEEIANWRMMANDQYGDCTCAMIGHMIGLWTVEHGRLSMPSDDDVLAVYAACTMPAFDRVTGDNDNGAYMLDVLNYCRKSGMAGHHLHGYVQISPGSTREASLSTYLFGALACGFNLPQSCQGQGALWDVPEGGASGSGAVGSWGGHAVPIVSYDEIGPTCVTWGGLQKMTWAFYATYCDEVYAVLGRDWIDEASQKAPHGFDFQQLQDDLAAI